MLFLTLVFALPLVTSSRYHHFQYQPRKIQCHCVIPQQCNDDDVAMNGHGLLDPRKDGACLYSEICCNNPKNPAVSSNDPADYDSLEETNPQPSLPCGYAATHIKSRITSGATTTFAELPWNLIIQERTENEERNVYKCGASLIHPRVALTAAHCVEPYAEQAEKILVRAGEWNVDIYDEPLPFQDNSVEEVLIHNDYSPISLRSDVAILVLAKSFQLKDNVRVVCMATPDRKLVQNGCLASGWGKDAHEKGRYSSILKKVKVPIISREFCMHKLRETRLGPRYVLHKNFLCAGGKKNEDSCKGDGGSPLICPLLDDKKRFVQVGIVSWGIGCGREGIPGIYVNVMPYLEWIESEMGERDLDTSYFKI